MNAPVLELEGTWEEVAAHAPELKGQRVRLRVISEDKPASMPVQSPRPSFGRSFLRHAGTWQGEGFEDCLHSVVEARGPIEFRNE